MHTDGKIGMILIGSSEMVRSKGVKLDTYMSVLYCTCTYNVVIANIGQENTHGNFIHSLIQFHVLFELQVNYLLSI